MSEDSRPAFETVRRRAAVAAAVLAVAGLVGLPFEPALVFGAPASGAARSAADALRILTDADAGGPISDVFRLAVYALLAAGVAGASVLAALSALRSRWAYSLVLAEALALSALGLSATFVLHPLLRRHDAPDAVTAVLTLAGLGALALSVGRILNFAAVFPRPLDDRELDEAARLHAATQRRPRAFGIPLGRARSPDRLARNLRRTFRLAQRGWLGPLLGGTVVLVAAVDPALGVLALWYAFFVFVVGGYPLVRFRERAAAPEERERLRWIVVGFHSSAWAFVVLTLAPFGFGPLMGGVGYGIYLASSMGVAPFAVYLCMVASLAVAVTYRGDVDPELALRRGTVVGFGLVAFVGLFGAVENLVSEWIEAALGLSGAAGPMVTGAIIAVALLPLRPLFRKLAAKLHPGLVEVPSRGDEPSASATITE